MGQTYSINTGEVDNSSLTKEMAVALEPVERT